MPEIKQTILVVDDEPETVDSLFDTFSDNYKVHKAFSAKEALEIIETNQIDLVISDQLMPEITGVEFFEQTGKNHPNIGKIILTGYLEDKAITDGINKGSVDKYLSKPWEEEDILKIVEETLNTRKE